MKKLAALIIAFMMLVSLAACTAPKPASNEAANTEQATETAATEEPAEDPTEEPTAEPDPTEAPIGFEVGGTDFCMELKLGETYRFDLDGDMLGDTVVYEATDDGRGYEWPNLKVTFGAYPDDTVTWDVPQDICTIWVVDSFPETPGLEIIETDEGDSCDPNSSMLIAKKDAPEFDMVCGRGVMIDAEHPFSSENGFYTEGWTDFAGTCIVEGRERLVEDVGSENGWALEPVDGAYLYAASYGETVLTVRKDFEAKIVGEDGEEGETVTVTAGSKVSPYATDNRTFIIFRLEDGALVRTSAEYRDIQCQEFEIDGEMTLCVPWFIAGEWQDLLLSGIFYSG